MSQILEGEMSVSEEDALRAQIYRLISRTFSAPADAALLSDLSGVLGDETALGEALGVMGAAARETTAAQAEDDYNRLFIGMTRGEFVPYASYYITGFLNEKPLAELRGDMARLGIERADGVSEPEDHIASIADMMAGMILGDFGMPSPLCDQNAFFDRHLASWAERFFSDLEGAQGADFYRAAGAVGRIFMTIEREAFSMVGS